ncbi:MAG: hypothetical protein A2086_12545 [Spirochaetes bacterium GWD1_27_9]|nr:MAG: hypothetical protein A2Z98_10910 [Spirochaetes bacterium GWB1_27_13]OHD28191.1 MAG: hypothetical protein A2Y34_07285 [Spirochaetes bacterium GWC1_27_15]OHD44288.1 MAG: hypothetical protein A2086_12545 [Spirochaetes bacterium GWD1_27_9]
MQKGIIASIDKVMYSCGLEILHPGGIEKTDEMAKQCNIDETKIVLDIGSGKGFTACYLAEKYKCQVIGIDLSGDMIDYSYQLAKKKKLTDKVSFKKMDATNLDYEDDFFDIVFSECVTVLLDQKKALKESIRVTKKGGFVADLEMIWKKPPIEELIKKTYDIWGGFKTVTLEEWQNVFIENGLTNIKPVDFSYKMLNMKKDMMKQIGLFGLIKMGFIILNKKDIRKAFIEYQKIFNDYVDYLGYGYIVGQKPH